MTPENKTSLEGIIGRELTQEETDVISPMIEDGRYPAIASILSLVKLTPHTRMISARGLAELVPGGPFAAEVILMKLEGARDALLVSVNPQEKVLGSLLRRQLNFLNGEGLDFGSSALRSMLDQFGVLGILSSEEVQGLKSIAMKPTTVSDKEVKVALGVQE